MKKYIYVFGVLVIFALASLADAAQVTIYNVSWKSRWPWNGLIVVCQTITVMETQGYNSLQSPKEVIYLKL